MRNLSYVCNQFLYQVVFHNPRKIIVFLDLIYGLITLLDSASDRLGTRIPNPMATLYFALLPMSA